MKPLRSVGLKLLAGVGLLAFSGLVPEASARIFYVQVGAAGNGLTCSTPMGTIAGAIAAAKADPAPTDEIRIAAGTYNERNIVIDFSGVSLKGGYQTGFPGCLMGDASVETTRNMNPSMFPAIIDGQSMGRILNIVPDTSGGGLLTSVLINIEYVNFINGQPTLPNGGVGGAILLLNSEVTISHALFQNNTSAEHFFGGGAIYMAGYYNMAVPGQFNAATLDLSDSTFIGNETGRGGIGSGSGGAIFASDFNFNMTQVSRRTRLTATNNVFRQNISNGSGDLDPATYCPDQNGDGIFDFTDACNKDRNGDGQPDASNTWIGDRCHAPAQGGAVFLANVSGTWSRNTFDTNTAAARPTTLADASGRGGALFTVSSTSGFGVSPTITNNTFSNNKADAGRGAQNGCGWFGARGGAAYMLYFEGTFSRNTLTNNSADGQGGDARNVGQGGGLMLIPQGSPTVDTNTFTGNVADAGSGRLSGWGGGLYIDEGQDPTAPLITNNTFTGNQVIATAPGSAYGGAIAAGIFGAYPVIAHNTIEGNAALGVDGTFNGLGGGIRLQLGSPDALVADNIIRQNTASEISSTSPLYQMGGAVFFPSRVNDTTASPRIQNNLFADNDGVGLNLMGIPTDQNGDMMTADPDEMAFCSPPLYNNTITNNTKTGLMMNLADDLLIDSSIIFGNNTSRTMNAADIDDVWLTNSRPSKRVVVTHSDIGTIPLAMDSPDLVASVTDPANGNISTAPLFVAGSYYLQQPPDNPGMSPAVDAGSVIAAQRDFGINPAYAGETMAKRTTRSLSKAGDLCFVDMGFHYPGAMPPPPDADGDTISDADEALIGTLPNDADTDNDGVVDGLDCGSDIDMDGTIAALDCDTDGDGMTDGTELGVTAGEIGAGTDTTARCNTSNAACGNANSPTFTADSDEATTTDPLNPDTDGGGEPDGCEDPNHDGRYNPASERNPNDFTDDDADHDTLNNGLEGFLGTDPLDGDTDDDGVGDGDEINAINPDQLSDALNCDTDFDRIFDGTERSLGPVLDSVTGVNYTDCPPRAVATVTCCIVDGVGNRTCFVPDADPSTSTNTACASPAADCTGTPDTSDCVGWDTDGDTCPDGVEDTNHNGAKDTGEPGDASVAGDCAAPSRELRIDGTVTKLECPVGGAGCGADPPCGPVTQPREASIMATSCATPRYSGCSATFVLPPTRVRAVTPDGVVGTPDLRLSGEAVDTFEPGVLTFYELEDCDLNLLLSKSGTDLIVDTCPVGSCP